MCRLFSFHSGRDPVDAAFWLLDAPDSLVAQSRLQPDGVGLGWFDAHGEAHLDKRPVAAYEDELFAAEARRITSRTVIAHIRHASTGSLRFRNTHPFQLDELMFAHNGVVEGLDLLEREIGPADMQRLVHGDTDSERVFALITQHIERANGDIGDGIVSAIGFIARNLPVYALNFILISATDVWALRWPDQHELWLLRRIPTSEAVQGSGEQSLIEPHEFVVQGSQGRIRMQSVDRAVASAVLVASEPLDGDPRWRLMAPGELVHVAVDLAMTSTMLEIDPTYRLTDAELDARIIASQQVGVTSGTAGSSSARAALPPG